MDRTLPMFVTWLNTRRLLVVALFLGIFAMALQAPLDSDTWWHLAAGDWIRAHGTIPVTDPFSHTMAGQPWIEHGWLPDVAASLVFEHLGYAGLGLLLALIVSAAFGFVYAQSTVHPFVRAFAILLAAITSSVYWSMRPQIVSFLLFAIVAWMLHRYREGHRRVIALFPPLMLLWANCHGAWITGYILVGAHLLGEVLNHLFGGKSLVRQNARGTWSSLLRLGAVAGLSLPLVALNPHGVRMLTYPFKTVGIGVLQDYIQEWASPNFHTLNMQPFIWLLLLTIAAIGLAGRRAHLTDLITLSGFCYMALMAGRNIALFAVVAAPILATYGQEALLGLRSALTERYPSLRRWEAGISGPQSAPRPALLALNWAIVALLSLAVAARASQPLSRDFNEAAQADAFPAGAVTYMQAHELPGEMFNTYNWGGYLIWKLYPQQRVFIDGRTDLYDDEFVRAYLAVMWIQPGWQETLSQHGVGHILIEKESPLASHLTSTLEWTLAYEDEIAAIFVRQPRRSSSEG